MKNFGLVTRLREALAVTSDNNPVQMRTNQFGEQVVRPLTQDQFGLEGDYFVTTTTTPGTGIALGIAAATTLIATAPALLIKNNNTIGTKDVILKRLSLTCTSANTGGTSLESAIYVDSASRWTSGGIAMTPANCNANSGVASSVQIFNASTAIVSTAAGSSTRLVDRCKIRTAVNVLGDIYKLNFGSEPTTETGLLTSTSASLYAHGRAPIVLPPQASALIYLWSPGQTTAPTYEVQIEHIER